MSRYVGIDLQRRRWVVVILEGDGRMLSWCRVENSPLALAEAVSEAGPAPEVVFRAVFTAEIGDIHRFSRPEQLCCWAGLTPRHRQSDDKVQRGSISKQGSVLVRWAAVEAVARYQGGAPIKDAYQRIAQRRGNKVARVAAARRLLTLVFYGLRDGEIRCLQTKVAA